ncbi:MULTISPECIES: DUF4190 domain-containing protein [unclassified Rathayibacter]|uniref:DUF4190 domain-containing protein n=1 Tax=unclassified Rathayibacter TaxID=2609250 RepID=UPI0006F2FAEE|nr:MULTISPECIES: DUF4190 domain-containing protein [unclassified Rathayibacter]KQQ06182.1 hypothetical protein ASF42_06610 [Rathayibacter sp. Leaf294]KQS14038.1 hypothetical protein ASG06_06615 [Rathayibacter sp. Leaf185]
MTMPPPPVPPVQPAPEPNDAPLPPYGSPPAPTRSGLAITALVLGVVAVVLAVLPFVFGLAFPVAIAGVVVGIIALVRRKAPRGFSIAGLALSVLGFLIAIVVTIVAVVQLATALDDFDASDFPEPTSSVSAEPLPFDDETPADDAPPAAADDLTVGFGDTFAYTDGVTLTVSAPEEFTPTEYAAGADQAVNVVFTLTIQNGSGQNLDPFTYADVSSGGVEASRIFDTDGVAGDISTSPSTVILPGGSVTWKEAYSLADPASIVMQLSPSFDYQDAVFTNTQ